MSAARKPTTTEWNGSVDLESVATILDVPKELRNLSQWVCWRLETPPGRKKVTKVPYQATDVRKKADPTGPATWSTFTKAMKAWEAGRDSGVAGIGFVFSPDDPFCGVDLDNSIVDGGIAVWARPIIERLMPTYAEISPSGTGVKLWVRAELSGTGTRKADYNGVKGIAVEIYDRARFFTVTGRIVDRERRSIEDRAAVVTELYDLIKPGPKLVLTASGPVGPLNEDQLIAKAKANPRNGAKFSALFDGSIDGYASKSEADLALCSEIAFWVGPDPVAIDRVFRQSGLFDAKWDRPTYRDPTIAKACERTKFYDPKWRGTGTTTETGKRSANGKPASQAPPLRVVSDDAPPATITRGFNLTDLGNAERLVSRHGRDLRYCHTWKRWMVWDGRRWATDTNGASRRKARDTVRSIYAEASQEPDEDRRKALARWGMESEKRDRISAMLFLSEPEDGIPVEHDNLDTDPWAFNCPNGTIDLKTGQLRPHRRADLITKLCPVAFDPAATCELWDSTLRLFFGDNAEMIDYFQAICGYALAGVIRDHIMPIAYGTGSNGKSTMLGTIMDVFGTDYAMKCPPEMLMAKRGDSHPTDRADLFGKRLVVAIESEENRRLNETMVKELTGGDKIRARRMREDFWEFAPSHTLILATNHKPAIKNTDDGIWRRLRLLPFDVRVMGDDADKAMPEKLRAEFPGILAWCVRGCVRWQAEGLKEPQKVVDASNEYRESQDVLGSFIAECCLVDRRFRVKSDEIIARYKTWCDQNNETAISGKAFGSAMEQRGFERKKSTDRWYIGIQVKHEDHDLFGPTPKKNNKNPMELVATNEPKPANDDDWHRIPGCRHEAGRLSGWD